MQVSNDQSRIGIVSIIVEMPEAIDGVNHILTTHANLITGRMGIPNPNGRPLNVIAVFVDGTNDAIGHLSGQLGRLQGVSVKAAVSKASYPIL